MTVIGPAPSRDANQAAAWPPVIGLASMKPCRYVAPRRASSSACSTVSTPSATVLRFSVCASAMTADAISAWPSASSATKDRSTFKQSTGRWRR